MDSLSIDKKALQFLGTLLEEDIKHDSFLYSDEDIVLDEKTLKSLEQNNVIKNGKLSETFYKKIYPLIVYQSFVSFSYYSAVSGTIIDSVIYYSKGKAVTVSQDESNEERVLISFAPLSDMIFEFVKQLFGNSALNPLELDAVFSVTDAILFLGMIDKQRHKFLDDIVKRLDNDIKPVVMTAGEVLQEIESNKSTVWMSSLLQEFIGGRRSMTIEEVHEELEQLYDLDVIEKGDGDAYYLTPFGMKCAMQFLAPPNVAILSACRLDKNDVKVMFETQFIHSNGAVINWERYSENDVQMVSMSPVSTVEIIKKFLYDLDVFFDSLEQDDDAVKRCLKCHAKVKYSRDLFCRKCGAKLNNAV